MVKPKCIGTTLDDKPCKNPRMAGSMYCAVHKPQELSDAPRDVKWSILLEVAPKDLPNFCATSREFSAMCRDPKFREAYKAKWARPDFLKNEVFTKTGAVYKSSKSTLKVNWDSKPRSGILHLGVGSRKWLIVDLRGSGEKEHIMFHFSGERVEIGITPSKPDFSAEEILAHKDIFVELEGRGITPDMSYAQIKQHINKSLDRINSYSFWPSR